MYAEQMTNEEIQIDIEDARNAPGSPGYHSFDEVVETFYKSVSTQLKGNDQKEFDLYLTGYLQGLKDFDVVQDRNLDGDAALIVCADALNKWRERYDK